MQTMLAKGTAKPCAPKSGFLIPACMKEEAETKLGTLPGAEPLRSPSRATIKMSLNHSLDLFRLPQTPWIQY